MRALRLLATAVLAVGFLPLAAAPANAAPPANDVPEGAVELHLGDQVEQDTSEATTDTQDADLNASCGAPATNASVWYQYTPDADQTVVLDMTASDYSGGMLVFAGTPTADSLVTCGPGVVVLRAEAGTTYNIMVISDTDVNGGNLVLSLEEAPPPPLVHVSVAKRGVVFRGGAARLHGTYSCKNGEFTAVGVTLRQRAGRLKIRADSGKEIRCNGGRHHWSVRLVSAVGTYAGGHAFAKVEITACGVVACRNDRTKREIHLAWAAGSPRQRSAQTPTRQTERPRPLVEHQRSWPSS
jgi:hypothetical protein